MSNRFDRIVLLCGKYRSGQEGASETGIEIGGGACATMRDMRERPLDAVYNSRLQARLSRLS